MMRAFAIGATVLGLVATAVPAKAQEPDEIMSKSTVWRPLTPDDKLVVYGVDDPAVEGVACHYTTPDRGGVKGGAGLAPPRRRARGVGGGRPGRRGRGLPLHNA